MVATVWKLKTIQSLPFQSDILVFKRKTRKIKKKNQRISNIVYIINDKGRAINISETLTTNTSRKMVRSVMTRGE